MGGASTTKAATPCPCARSQAWVVTHQRSPGVRPGNSVLGDRSAQVVADALLELEELGRDHRADRVGPEITGAGAAAAVAVEAGERVGAAGLRGATEHVSLHVGTVPPCPLGYGAVPHLTAGVSRWYNDVPSAAGRSANQCGRHRAQQKGCVGSGCARRGGWRVAQTAPAAVAQGLQIDVLSTRADLVSGGQALTSIELPAGTDPASVAVGLNGRTSRASSRCGRTDSSRGS